MLVQQWCQQTLFVYKSAKSKHTNLLKHKYCYPLYQTLDITYGILCKLCCYSNRWLWVRLNFADVLKMERYPPLFSFFLYLGQKLTIVRVIFHWLLAMIWLPNTQTIYEAIQHSFDTYYCINILHNMCPEIIIMSSLTQQLFNSGYDKWLPSRKYLMSHVFTN